MNSALSHRTFVNFVASLGAPQKSDSQWDAAQELTAKAGEQSRIAQSRTTEAVKFTQTAEEARRAAEQAHNKESEIEVCSASYSSCAHVLWFSRAPF